MSQSKIMSIIGAVVLAFAEVAAYAWPDYAIAILSVAGPLAGALGFKQPGQDKASR